MDASLRWHDGSGRGALVAPAKAGAHAESDPLRTFAPFPDAAWMPACAGMTGEGGRRRDRASAEHPVAPAKAGAHAESDPRPDSASFPEAAWMPAFAGMTREGEDGPALSRQHAPPPPATRVPSPSRSPA